MRNSIALLAVASAILLTGCEKKASTTKNDAAKKHFEIWMTNHYPQISKTAPGIYILEDTPGKGIDIETYEKYPYVSLEYLVTDLEGTISDYTSSEYAKQLGTYDESIYYGPQILSRHENGMIAGVEAVLDGMKVGGTRKAVIPGWLMTYKRYDKEEGYLKNITGSNYIYTITVKDIISDITKWEIDSLTRYVNATYPGLDSLKYGFYYKQLKAPSDTNAFESGTEISINYVGRKLDGRAFDTNIKDTAKVWGLYSSSGSYGPSTITVKEDYSEYVMGSSSSDGGNMIDGFSYALSKMRTGEKGICMFYSGLGYSSSGSGDKIPGFCPLVFEIELIGENID